jgi:hypothetical protein
VTGGLVRQRLIAAIALVGAFVLTPPLWVGAQPLPVPQGPPGSSMTTYDAQGRRFETYSRPDGGSVTYGPGGERFETFATPGGGTVTYGPNGQRFESRPSPAETAPGEKGK